MKVILLQDVPSLGKKNDTVSVKDGYARNFLIPKNLAWDATPKNMKLLHEQKQKIAAIEKKQKQEAESLAEKISAVNCTLYCQAGEQDKLFGSITNQDIHKFLKAEGIEVDKRDILLEDPIKALGVFFVDIRLDKDVKATIKVWVVKEEDKKDAEKAKETEQPKETEPVKEAE